MELNHPESGEDAYQFQGEVETSLPHGSILRYTVVKDSQAVDVLFRSGEPLSQGEKVTVTLPRKHCVFL